MSEQQQIEAGLAALEAQRALLGDSVVELAAAPLRARLEALRAQQAAAQPQLRQVTVLFVDTVGSTAMGRKLDPEDIQAVMDGALARFTGVVQAHRGRVLQYTGDGLLAAFGADESQEDDAERAVRAGLAILAEARRVASEVAAAHGVDGFDVRVGVDTGPALLGGGVDAEGTIRGTTVSMAARMEQTAPPGGLRMHQATYRHVRGLFRVSAQPPLTVKGVGEPLQTYLVHGVRPRSFRSEARGIEGLRTPLVAREAELDQLRELFLSIAASDGSALPRLAAATIVADPGLGKSRLLHAFEAWVDQQPQRCIEFRGRADPQTMARPFGLLRDVIAERLQIADDDEPETARRKLVAQIEPLFAADGRAQAHLLGQLIGMDFSASEHVAGILDDARQIRNRGFHAAAQLLRLSAAALRQPLLLLLDDLHWADDGSLDFVNYLAQVNRDVPTLMLCTTRPTLFERRPDLRLLESTFTRIELQPLDKRASRELAQALLQRMDRVPAALGELLIGNAEGNPFHMEELLRMLIDDGAILAGGDRWQVVPDKLLAAQVPPTLTGVLQARLDGLPPPERWALQQAAVIGMVFRDEALAALDPDAPLALPALLRRGLLLLHGGSAADGAHDYAFKHQALHQVTYDSLLKRQRREAHARMAAWLAQHGRGQLPDMAGTAAQHFDRAGDIGNACRHYIAAAEDAAARYANEAMLGFVARALAIAPADDWLTRWQLLLLRERQRARQADRTAHREDLDALDRLAEAMDDDARRAAAALRRSGALLIDGDAAAAEAAARRGLALCQRIDDARLAVQAQLDLANALIVAGRYAEAREQADAGLALARAHHDRAGESKLVNALGLIAMEQGDLPAAIAAFESGLQMVRAAGNRDDEGIRLSNLGSCCSRLGDYAAARRHLDDALQVARLTGQRATEALVLLNVASAAHLAGDDPGALAYANAALDAAVETGQPDLEAYSRMVAGHAELGLGRLDAAAEAYARSRDLLQALPLRPQQALDPVSGLARVALAGGRLGEALAHVEPLLAHLAAGGSFDGAEEPLLLPLTCYQVLRAAGDPRAAGVLATAMAELQAQAARIGDARARRGFLEQVPHHRELCAAWAGSADGEGMGQRPLFR